jgi:hypothetical protein
MKINIVGQYGFANVGDEGILQAIMDSLGLDHEYIVSTSLPFNLIGNYHFRLPSASNVRTLDDERMDYDACIYGGGKVDWGFGWGHFIRAFNANKKTMAYGIALRTDQDNTKLRHLYEVFFNQFQRVTVRDMATKELLVSMLNNSTLTMCPAINLKEQKTSCPEGAIAVCPRYGDYNQWTYLRPMLHHQLSRRYKTVLSNSAFGSYDYFSVRFKNRGRLPDFSGSINLNRHFSLNPLLQNMPHSVLHGVPAINIFPVGLQL